MKALTKHTKSRIGGCALCIFDIAACVNMQDGTAICESVSALDFPYYLIYS